MNIPKLSDNNKHEIYNILRKSTYSEGLMYIGDYEGGNVFVHKKPKRFRGMCVGLPLFLYVKNQVLYAVDSNSDEMFSEFCGMFNSIDEDNCYTITLDDENK